MRRVIIHLNACRYPPDDDAADGKRASPQMKTKGAKGHGKGPVPINPREQRTNKDSADLIGTRAPELGQHDPFGQEHSKSLEHPGERWRYLLGPNPVGPPRIKRVGASRRWRASPCSLSPKTRPAACARRADVARRPRANDHKPHPYMPFRYGRSPGMSFRFSPDSGRRAELSASPRRAMSSPRRLGNKPS
jgi:hypothetical protein